MIGYFMCINFCCGGGKIEGRKCKCGVIIEGDCLYFMVVIGGIGRGVFYKFDDCWRWCYCEVIYICGFSNCVII